MSKRPNLKASRKWRGHSPALLPGWALRALATVLAMLVTGGVIAQTQLTEHQMQAAVLGNLAKFIEWPLAAEEAPAIRIGILGHDPFGSDIEAVLKEAKVKSKGFAVERSSNVRDLLDCHIIYFSSQETEKLTEARLILGRKPILTVGEHPNFLSRGGMVNFHIESNRTRFAINLKNAEEAGLAIHTQVLRLATEVRK